MKSLLAYKLKPDELEQRFRDELFIKDRKHTAFILIIAIAIIAGYSLIELYLAKSYTLPFCISLVSRAVVIISVLSGVILMYRTKRKYFDLIIFVLSLIMLSHFMAANFYRQYNPVAVVTWGTMVVLAIYAMVPSQLIYQIICAMFLTIVSNILGLFASPSMWKENEILMILSGYLTANIFGIFLSLQLKRSRRQQYQILEKERGTRQGLEKAQKEVKKLQGILPICSFCKNIRNDEGYYEKVDAYIARHSEADFSHTVCPDCAKKHYSEYLTD